MARSHAEAQDLAEKVYDTARASVRRTAASAVGRLDKIAAGDAEKLKDQLRKLFQQSGIPLRRAEKMVDDVFDASRAQRIRVVEAAIREASTIAQGVDKKTFRAVFGGEREAAVPLGRGRSASSRSGTPWLRLVSVSEDGSTLIDSASLADSTTTIGRSSTVCGGKSPLASALVSRVSALLNDY